MKKLVLCFLLVFSIQSCIPVRIAPSISDYEVKKGKRFKRSLSKRTMFIFEDPKEADEFYQFVNIKYDLNNQNVYDDVPFEINDEQFFFAFYEVEIPDKSLNIFPALFNVVLNEALGNEDTDTEYIEAEEIYRRENWYIAIEVYSDTEEDVLHEKSLFRTPVLQYLRLLKKEYLSTNNYNEIVFKN